MTLYAKRSCSKCGIRLPQPDMSSIEITPIGLKGRPLSPRPKWFCPKCAAPKLQAAADSRWRAEKDAKENSLATKVYREKKAQWAQEQERRRLANLRPDDVRRQSKDGSSPKPAPKPSWLEAIRQALTEHLKTKGYLK